MLPPILEIYVVWHPLDHKGRDVANVMVDHFQGSTFTGLIGGAVEVYVRVTGWLSSADAPRPIPFPTGEDPGPDEPPQQLLTVVVPVVDLELAVEVERGTGPWFEYLAGIVRAQRSGRDRIAIFPVATASAAARGTRLGEMLEEFHGIGRGPITFDTQLSQTWCRDLAQGVTQYFGDAREPNLGHSGDAREPNLGHSGDAREPRSGNGGPYLRRGEPVGGPFGGEGDRRLTVFISHTSRVDADGNGSDGGITARVQEIVARTRLRKFYSTIDLQPGSHWSQELAEKARSSALLAVRTSTFATRPWCQREMVIAKTAGMPIVVLDALEHPEERGSFLMDHVPRVPVRRYADGGWRDEDILAGLNLLVDECLKRALWLRQRDLATDEAVPPALWWSTRAPEPVTLTAWLSEQKRSGTIPEEGMIRIIHPDPPMGPDEFAALAEILYLAGLENRLDVVTPRLLAARLK